MRSIGGGSGRWLGRLLACCVAGVMGLFVGLLGVVSGSGAFASADTSAGVGGAGGAQTLSLDSLTVPGIQPLDEDQQAMDEQGARHSSSATYVARLRSSTEFEHLGTAQAAHTERKLFPALIERPTGGPPALPAGVKLARYTGVNVAQLDLPGDKHGVMESTAPMARQMSRGHFTPIDLALTGSGGSYTPVVSDVSLQIPKRLQRGVMMPADGISVTPVDAQGHPVGGAEGSADGASMLYTNTEVDTDTVVKPLATGFELDALLRSQQSPGRLYLRVGMPAGARLVQERGSRGARVLEDGRTIAVVDAPSALDAAGSVVPVSMHASGDTLALSVVRSSGEYQYPIVVDPPVTIPDWELTGKEAKEPGNWKAKAENEYHGAEKFLTIAEGYGGKGEQLVTMTSKLIASPGEYMEYYYTTQGKSRIYGLEAVTSAQDIGAHSKWAYEGGSGEGEREMPIKEYYSGLKTNLCAKPPGETECPTTGGSWGNRVKYQLTATGKEEQFEGEYSLWAQINSATVYIYQEEGASFSVNNTEPTIDSGRQNVLYGSGSWLGPNSGAMELKGFDPGIGVSQFAADTTSGGSWSVIERIYEQHHCAGVQCPEHTSITATYSPKMADGEDTIELSAYDEAGIFNYTDNTNVKVDSTPPYNLGFTGMPEEGAEISAAPHKLTVHATDGKKPILSSGVKSLGVSIDGGKETVLPSSSCTAGECTASGTYTLYAEALTEGVHWLTVTATDNAGNVESEEFFFDVRHGNPVSVGPGTVDPTSGQFALTATDVSSSGGSGVKRTYQSRDLTAGAEGPLGPQWAISIGDAERLTALPNGSVVLVASNGGQTTFFLNEKGEFESPKGDQNFKMEYESKERKYLLKDAATGTETVFEQPSGNVNTSPAYSSQFGPEAAQLAHPESVATDAKGDVWVTDFTHNRIQEFSPSGTLLGTYGSEGSGSGQFIGPWGIAVNQSTGNVYVTDQANNRIEEFSASGAFIKAFGWGVTDGNEGPEVCTGGCRAGFPGAGNGEVHVEAGLTVDASGNIWVADYGNDRVQEFNEKGEYIQKFGSEGIGNGLFKGPLNIAFSGANLYVVDYGNNRVQEFSPAGKYERQFGNEGSESERLKNPRGIGVEASTGNVYVTDAGNNRVQEFSTSGARITKFGSAGAGSGQLSEPTGVAIGALGGIYVTDFNNNRVEEWGRPTWVPISAKGPAASTSTTYSYKAVTAGGETVVEPAEELGPKPEGAVCSAEPEKSSKAEKEKEVGCRELTFKYGTKTIAGEKESEWGEYEGRLMEVKFTGYNPSSKEMKTTVVAQYAYDKLGRLRAEWDPRISPTLKTIYGYDTEGHITALTPPGQGTWAFTYGTTVGDPNMGRLLKVTQGRSLEGGEALYVIEGPTISGTPVVGVKLGVWRGTYGGGAVAYGYQWKDCNSAGKECTPILGATNANYQVSTSDVGHTLAVQATATNGGGSAVVLSNATAVVTTSGTKTEGESHTPEVGWAIEYHLPVAGTGRPNLPNMTKEEVEKWGQKDKSESEDNDPAEGMAIFPPDEPQGWPASSYKRATIDYLNEKGLTVNTSTPSGGVSTTEYNAFNEAIRTLSPDNQAKAMAEGCKSVSKKECKSAEVSERLDTQTEYNGAGSEIVKTMGPEHNVKLSTGAEAVARAVTHNYYDKGAKEVEEKTHEAYNLVTQTVEGALLSTGEEVNKREAVTAYSGQENLGWKLRKPTSVTKEPGGLNLTTTTVYEEQENAKKEKESNGSVMETRSLKGSGSGPMVVPAYGFSSGVLGSGNGQFKEPRGVAVDSSNNLWVVDSENNRLEKLSPSGSYLAAYGSSGSGAGQFSGATGIAINRSSGNIYVSDRLNMRVEEFSAAGAFVRTFGFGVSDGLEKPEVCTSSCRKGNEGAGGGQFHTPDGVTIDAVGNVWVADYGNNRVEEFSSEGAFIAAYGSLGSGNGQFQSPESVAYDNGLLYVTDTGNNRIEELSTSGKYRGQFGSNGTGNGQFSSPSFIAADPVSGSLYVLDVGNSRVQEFTLSGTFLGAFGSKGTGGAQFGSTEAFSPDGIAVNVAGDIYAADTPDNRVETWISVPGRASYTSQFGSLGSGNGQFHLPVGVALDASGNQWVTDYYNNRIEKFSSAGAYLATYGGWGTGAGQMIEPVGIAINKSSGYVYISDQANNRVEEFNPSGAFVSVWGFGVSNGEEKFQVCTVSCQAGRSGSGGGQFNRPGGVTIDSGGNVWVVDENNHRVEEFSSAGSFTAAVGWGVKDEKAEAEVCTTTCLAGISGSGNGQLNKPAYIAASDGNIYVTDYNNNRVERFSTAGAYVSQFGTVGTGNGQFKGPAGITADAYGNVFIVDDENDRVEEFTRYGTYVTSFGTKGTGNGQLNEPEGIAVDSTGVLHVVDSENNRIETLTPPPRPGNEGAHNTRIVYYSAKGEAEVAACQNHPEWANMTCQTEPVAQTGVSGAPELPVTKATYNLWNEPEIVEEKFGLTTRTKKETFDGAGREETSEVSCKETGEVSCSPTVHKTVPTVTDKYSKTTGALVEQSTTSEGKTKTITSAYNTHGQIEKYTDANGGTTNYTYETGGDGRLDEVGYEIGKEKFEQNYAYNATTGFTESLYDSGLKKYFTATYDVEGRMLTDTYPDNLTLHYTYNQLGTTTGIKYEKNAYCASKCPEIWFEDNIVPSIHGEVLKQTSTLAKEGYTYDNDGRLLEAQETPVGKGCTARLYAYDEDSNRTSLTTRESATETCPTEGGLVESHSYDSADGLIDAGISYETFGNTTKLPAPDAGKYELKSSYYVDNQVAGQTQQEAKEKERTLSYAYDPEGRTEETESVVKEGGTEKHEPLVISHYSSTGEALVWTGEEENKKWSRNIPGIDGSLDATQTSAGAIALQLHDLQGNVVGTVGVSETETKLLTTYNSTEFGVPSEGKPTPKYAWLGAGGVSSELPFSGTVTQGGASYVPQIARNLQTAPVMLPGACPEGCGSDETYVALVPEGLTAGAQATADQAVAEAAAALQKSEEEEARIACLASPLSCSGEPIDPIHHFTEGEAERYGEQLIAMVEEEDNAPGLIALLGDIQDLAMGPQEGIETLFGKNTVEEWALSYGNDLLKCVSELHRTNHFHGGCRSEVFNYQLFGFIESGVIDFFTMPKVSYCLGMSSDRKEVHWCTLLTHPASEGDID